MAVTGASDGAGGMTEAVVRVDGARLIDRLRRLARIGARTAGGMNRQAFSAEDSEARLLLAGWAREAGLEPSTDAIGNLYLRWAPEGTEGEAPVLSGSHADTQPTGGWLDGAYGVVAALEAVQSIRESGLRPQRPIEAVCWVNEEGSRFQPGMMGSAWFTGRFDLARAAAITDGEGVPLDRAIAESRKAASGLAERAAPFPVAALVEAHIEQGPILEREALPIGVVEGVQGIRWYRVEVTGETAHAGTTPRSVRRDALLAATRIVQALATAFEDPEDVLRFTVGRFVVEPGSPNTVADRVTFTIDLRHPEAATLEACRETIGRACAELASPCAATVARLEDLAPVRFDARVVAALGEAADALGRPWRRMVSGAGHDAAALAAHCPAAMVFVPCVRGVSHHPDEDAAEADLIAGADVLATALARLAR